MENVRRKVLWSCICAICHEAQYSHAERAALETLMEMLQSFLCELGRTSRNYCELSGRTEPTVADIDVALIVLGIRLDKIPEYGRRLSRRSVLPPLSQAPKQATPKILQAGEKSLYQIIFLIIYPLFQMLTHTYELQPTSSQ